MSLPTGDVEERVPPKMPGTRESGLPPRPPEAAPSAGEAVEQEQTETRTSVSQIHTQEEAPKQARKEETNADGPPAAPFAQGRADPGKEMSADPRGGYPQQQVSGNKLAEAASDMGFDGVDLTGFGAFPIVSLQKETFKTTEGYVLGDSFEGYPQGSRKKWIYKNGLANENPDVAFFYTYDDELSIKGEPIPEILAGWKERGWNYVKNPYVELFVRLEGGEQSGQVVALSIPKTSIPRFSNFIVTLLAKGGEGMKTTLCWFGKGPEVTKVRNPFIPLAFRVLD